MSSKLIFLLLTALLLVQYSVGKPMPHEETKKAHKAEDSSDSTNEDDDTGLFVLVEFTDFTYVTLINGKKLIGDVVADVNAMQYPSEALKIKIEEFTKFFNKLDKIDLNDRGFGFKDKNLGRNLALLNEINNLLDPFYTIDMKNLHPEDLIIEALLKRHGIEKLVKKANVKLSGFTKRFFVAADKHWDSLTPEEQTKYKMFAEWLKLLKEEPVIEKRIALLEKILELHEIRAEVSNANTNDPNDLITHASFKKLEEKVWIMLVEFSNRSPVAADNYKYRTQSVR